MTAGLSIRDRLFWVVRKEGNNRQMAKVVCLLAAALLLISSGAAYSRSQAHPTTLVWANGKIVAFAQDGDQIAWVSIPGASHRTCDGEVRIRLLGKHQQKLVACAGRDDVDFGSFRLAGRRTLWKVAYCGNYCHQELVTASYSKRGNELTAPELGWDYDWGYGDYVTATAGDSSTLVYGVVYYSGDCDVSSTETCTPTMSGYINRVTGASAVTIPGAPPPFMLAASGSRVAIVVAETAVGNGMTSLPGSPATVVVKDAVTGVDVGSFSPAGFPLAIAFAPSVVAVLESTAGGTQIEFRTPEGAILRTVAVPSEATGLSTNDTRAVFRVGKSIWTVSVAAGASKTVVTAANTPIGLSIEGKRVAWAENVAIHGVKRGRIRAITVP
jgi:hypothetical protein